MKTSEQTDKIDEVLALVQAKVGAVTKNKVVDTSRGSGDSGSGWKSGYATLEALDAVARPALIEHGVALVQGGGFVAGLGPVLETRLAYKGQWIESFFPVKTSRDGAQGFGGGITFARRWGLCCAVGLVPADAEEGQGYKDAARENKPPRRAAAPAGLAAVLDGIRGAPSAERFEAAARAARAAHPSGEQSNAVEGVITARMVATIDAATSADKLTELHDLNTRLMPRGSDVRAAFQRAEQRIGVGR